MKSILRCLILIVAAALVPAATPADQEGAPSRVVIPPAGEPGEPLVISGTVHGPDGSTPLPGAVLEVHHTDATGRYAPDGGATPRLKGRIVTDARGGYEFQTIRPASYPGSRAPAHIHARVMTPEGRWHELAEYWFADDPFVTQEMAAPHREAGRFSPIVTLSRDAGGVWRGVRDIRVPGRAGG